MNSARQILLTMIALGGVPAARAAAPAETKDGTPYYGLWLSDCSTDPSNGFPAQDALEFKADSFVQYSLIYHDSDDCSSVPIVTKISYDAQLKDRKKPKGSKDLALKPTKIELGAIDVKGAVMLSAQKECGLTAWRTQKWIDCSKAEPYKSVIRSESMVLMLRLMNDQLVYRDVTPSDDKDETPATDEHFTRVQGLPAALVDWK